MKWLDSSMDMNLSKLWEIVKDREVLHAAVHGVTELATNQQLNNNRMSVMLKAKEDTEKGKAEEL